MVCTDVCNDDEERLDLDVSNLKPSSNFDSIDNIFSTDPDIAWQPADDDNNRTLEIFLPDVNGALAGEYDIMNVTFKTTGTPGPVTVTIVDGYGNTTIKVCPESPCDFMQICVHVECIFCFCVLGYLILTSVNISVQ